MAPPKPWQASSSSSTGGGSTVATVTQVTSDADQQALPDTTSGITPAASPSTTMYPTSGYGLYGGGTTGLYGGGSAGGLYGGGGGSMYGGYGGGLYSGVSYGYPGGLMGAPGQQQELWFTNTAESLGRFNQMLEMHTMFLDQIYHHCGMVYARTTDLVSWLRGVLTYVKSGKLEENNIESILDRLGQSHRTPQDELTAIRRRVRVLSAFAVLLVLWLLWRRQSRPGTRGDLQTTWEALQRRY